MRFRRPQALADNLGSSVAARDLSDGQKILLSASLEHKRQQNVSNARL